MRGIEAPLNRRTVVLLVDDNDNDYELTKIALRKAKLDVDLYRVADGEACMAFLRKAQPYENSPTPDLLLLDINMPIMNGHEVLAEIGLDENLKHLPVVVLTSSTTERDILKSYQLRCNSYAVKPVDFETFQGLIHSLTHYWFSIVVIPNNDH